MNEDSKRRQLLTASTIAVGGVCAGAIGTVLLGSLRPSRGTKEGYRRVVDFSELKPGEFMQVEPENRPLMIYRRTQEQLRALEQFEDYLADPTSQESKQPEFAKNRYRSNNPEFLVVQPICTHLGCMVNYFPAGNPDMDTPNQKWRGGFFCPCHGAKFDMAGRVFKGMPAPTNLVVPPHSFINKTEIEFDNPKDAP